MQGLTGSRITSGQPPSEPCSPTSRRHLCPQPVRITLVTAGSNVAGYGLAPCTPLKMHGMLDDGQLNQVLMFIPSGGTVDPYAGGPSCVIHVDACPPASSHSGREKAAASLDKELTKRQKAAASADNAAATREARLTEREEALVARDASAQQAEACFLPHIKPCSAAISWRRRFAGSPLTLLGCRLCNCLAALRGCASKGVP